MINPGEYPALMLQDLWTLIGEKEVLILQLKRAIEVRDVFIAELQKDKKEVLVDIANG